MTDDWKEAALRRNVVIFEDRLILDARPPIGDDQLSLVQARCVGPIPGDLVALWRQAFGGTLDYELEIEIGGQLRGFSFTELFYPESDSYRNLWGWIQHEEELAEEAAEAHGQAWSGKLTHLPFGGFEYLDRLYVCVEPGPDHGAVFAWMHGLPPAWSFRLHEDSVARVADDMRDLFRKLDLTRDPFGAPEDFDAGETLAVRIEEIADEDAALAEALKARVRMAVIDWRRDLDEGRLADRPRSRRLALDHAAGAGDLDLLQTLQTLGCDLDEGVRGGASVLDLALMSGRLDVARWLLDQGVDVERAIVSGASKASPELLAELLARGARPDGQAAMNAAREGAEENAILILEALKDDRAVLERLVADLALWAQRTEDSAARVESGQMASNLSPEAYRTEGDRLRTFRSRCLALLGEGAVPTKPAPEHWWKRLFGA
jgi:hypothetical protein